MRRTREENINSKVMEVAILAMAAMVMINNSVLMPLLGNIKDTYPNISDLMLQGVLTLPAFTIMIAMVLSNELTKYFSPRAIISFGFAIFTITGVAMCIPMSFGLFITLRLIFGFGVGLTNPFVNTLIMNYFTGDKQTELMGYTTAARVLGGTIATGIAGIIAASNWRLAPLMYGIAIVPLVITLYAMDSEKLPPRKKGAHKMKDVFTPRIWVVMFLQMFLLIIDFVFITNISLVLSERSIAAPQMSSVLIICFNMMTMFLSMAFFKLYKKFDYKVMYISSAAVLSAFVMFTHASNFPELLIGSALMGVPAGILAPLLIRELGDAIVYPETTMTVFTVFAMSIFLGQFMSPIAVAIFKNTLNLSGTTGSFIVGIIFAVINFICLFTYFKVIVPKYNKKEELA